MISFLRVVVQTVSLLLTCMYVYVDNNLENIYVVKYFERIFQCKPPTGINRIPILLLSASECRNRNALTTDQRDDRILDNMADAIVSSVLVNMQSCVCMTAAWCLCKFENYFLF